MSQNMHNRRSVRIGILGGGPSGLFMYKRLLESEPGGIEITIIEKNDRPGPGMPFSENGANEEHITNESDNELPHLVTSVKEWLEIAPQEVIRRFGISPSNFHEYKVLPRLMFGEYLAAQFHLLHKQAKRAGIITNLICNTIITDIVDLPAESSVKVITESGDFIFDLVVICTGHLWPTKIESKTPNYFESPYPPSKLVRKVNYPVAIRGASLTAIDAVRTIARSNGHFHEGEDGCVSYSLSQGSEHFRIVLHSIDGLLPAIRIHLEDSLQSRHSGLDVEDLDEHKKDNGGFVQLDFIFERRFKQPIQQKDPDFYEKIKDMRIEEFVAYAMNIRERLDPFLLFKAEFVEARKSIERHQSVYWKEMLAVLSFAMNYPAKYLSAEDMMRLKKVLMPLISIVIAFLPQSSCLELLALYDAGVLTLVPVDHNSSVEPREQGGAVYTYADEDGRQVSKAYNMFIDCVGQRHLSFSEIPFKGLYENGSISPARLRFRCEEEGMKLLKEGKPEVEFDIAGGYYLHVPGIGINDNFQVLDRYGAYSERIYIMAVPFIGGFNPDYSGLDFCEAASERILKGINMSDLFSKKRNEE